MAYLIHDKAPAGAEVQRVLERQIARAHALLADWRANPRDNVHQARQAFKRIRALLRLIRPGARYVYRVENLQFRALARSLAYARDSEAVVDALGLLEERVSGPLARESLAMLRHGLEERARRERDCGIHDLQGRIDLACEALAAAARRVPDMPLDGLRRRHLRRGAERALRRCQAGYEAAAAARTPEAFHAWRREVKYAYYQTRLLVQIMPRWAEASGPALGRLAGLLGHYQDLCVLDRLLRSQVDELNIDVHLRSMRNALRDTRAGMADSALALGAGLQGHPPDAVPPGEPLGLPSGA